MLTAEFPTSEIAKTTPCTVEMAGSAQFGPFAPESCEDELRKTCASCHLSASNALPNSLYHIINLATGPEETNAEAEAA